MRALVQCRTTRMAAPEVERAAWILGIATLWVFGYFSLGARGPLPHQADLRTAIDEWIPFVGWMIWPYLLGIAFPLTPLIAIRCHHLFRLAAVGYVVVITASLACFLLFPAASIEVRPNPSVADLDPISKWAIVALHAIDPPSNLFPSLHVSLATLAALLIWKAAPRWGLLAATCATTISISVCTVKQHVVFDVVAGLALAAVVYTYIFRSYCYSSQKLMSSDEGEYPVDGLLQ
jgi:membrane-associated phospholipid phosphatase